jgi:hypothetical protein
MSVDSDDLLWYVAELADLFNTERPGDMAFELQDTVERLLDLASSPSEELSGSPAPSPSSGRRRRVVIDRQASSPPGDVTKPAATRR